MAQKRMLDKKISVSEQVANLAIEAQLIFTWAVPHADDLGLLPFSPRSLKALVVPMMDISLEDFGNHVESIVSQGLWEVFKHEKDSYYRIPKFCEHQTLKKDRKPNTYLFGIESWKDAEDIGFHLEDIGNPREEKRSKEKGTEEKITASIAYLKNIPTEDLKEFTERFEAYPKQIIRKAEDLVLWCETNGERKKNYRAFLLTALRKDFPERTKVEKPTEDIKRPLTPEEAAARDKIAAEIRAIGKSKQVPV